MVKWEPNPECDYLYDYSAIFTRIAQKKELARTPQEIIEYQQYENGVYRSLVLNDLYFILQFVMEIPALDDNGRPFCNSKFVVEKCQEVENGPDGWTLDLWARGHFKSSILTKARTIQRICKFPEKCTMIASHTRPIAKKFLRPIMLLLENNTMLKACFPDVLWSNARNESPKWSEDDGIIVRRKNMARSEATVEAWGLKEGMPISVHFDWIISDDLETKDDVTNPEVVQKVRSSFDLASDLLTVGGSIGVVGTPYSHNGVYVPFIRDKVKADGSNVFLFRRYPATEDGLPTGKAVFLSDEELADVRARKGEYEYMCQQMIDPTPVGVRKLEGSKLQDIESKFIPRNVYKFMVVDPAGDDKGKDSDAWAMMVIAIEPFSDEMGNNRVFITDAIISPMREEEAPEEIARMYLRNGLIMQLGIEKVGQSTAEIHVSNALAKRGRYISQDNGSLVILRPAGRNKQYRIEKAIPYPLYQNKIYVSRDIPSAYRDRLRQEMDMYPFWHDDGLDCLSYFYEMVTDYRFGWLEEEAETPQNVVSMTGRNRVTGY
jgi:hypothetical protein